MCGKTVIAMEREVCPWQCTCMCNLLTAKCVPDLSQFALNLDFYTQGTIGIRGDFWFNTPVKLKLEIPHWYCDTPKILVSPRLHGTVCVHVIQRWHHVYSWTVCKNSWPGCVSVITYCLCTSHAHVCICVILSIISFRMIKASNRIKI